MAAPHYRIDLPPVTAARIKEVREELADGAERGKMPSYAAVRLTCIVLEWAENMAALAATPGITLERQQDPVTRIAHELWR